MQMQHRAAVMFFGVEHLFVVAVDEKSQRRAGQSGGRLDYTWPNVQFLFFVKQSQALPAGLFVLQQIPTRAIGRLAAVGDTFQLTPALAERKAVLDVHGAFRVVRQLVSWVFVTPQILGLDAKLDVPAFTLVNPVVEPLFVCPWFDEVFELHLLELERPEDEVTGRNLVAKRLSDLRNAERQLSAHGIRHVDEVHKDALRGFWRQIGDVFFVCYWAD